MDTPPCCLVVDDDRAIRVMLRTVIRGWGWRCVQASNGVEALGVLHEDCPDVIITDIEMPELTGLELLRKVRQDDALPDVPVLVMSSLGAEELRPRVRMFRLAEFLQKPIDVRRLRTVLGEILEIDAGAHDGDGKPADPYSVFLHEVLKTMDDDTTTQEQANPSSTAGSLAATAKVPETMPAVIYEDYGDPSVLKLSTIDTPGFDDNDVVVLVKAAGVNPVDARLRQGELRMLLPGGFPRVPGYDVAGLVVKPGRQSSFVPGDRVLGFLRSPFGGGYAEYAACDADTFAKIPGSMSFLEAAALPLAGSTALQSLRYHGHLKAGHRVLINGASGGVGAFAVQIAKADGAHVTAVASGKNEGFVRSLGADEFIDYHDTNFTSLGQSWDLIFDAAGKSSYSQCRVVLEQHGRFVSTEPSAAGLLMSALTLPLSKKGRVMLAKSQRADLAQLIGLYEQEKLKIHVDQVFPLASAEAAHERLEQGGGRGKLVIDVTGDGAANR